MGTLDANQGPDVTTLAEAGCSLPDDALTLLIGPFLFAAPAASLVGLKALGPLPPCGL